MFILFLFFSLALSAKESITKAPPQHPQEGVTPPQGHPQEGVIPPQKHPPAPPQTRGPSPKPQLFPHHPLKERYYRRNRPTRSEKSQIGPGT